MKYAIPVLFVIIVLFAAYRRVNVFSSFTKGVNGALKFTLELIPVIACTFMMCELFERSGLSQALANLLAPMLEFFGVPPQLARLILIKPFSGSGSLTYLTQILTTHGADGYIGRCACVLYGSSETVFYISAVYFAACKQKKRIAPVAIVLAATAISTVISCALCRIL